jgi:hypothetical protein
MVRVAALATGLGSAMLKCLLIALTLLPLYLLLLLSAAIVWFMVQLRFFLAVSGTMMLPLFVGMFSLPEGHFNRQAAQSYVMHMVSLALWPVAWAIGHTGTIALYNALVSLVAGTSRVPDLADPAAVDLDHVRRARPRPSSRPPRRRSETGSWATSPPSSRSSWGAWLHALGRDRVHPRAGVPAQAPHHRGPLHDAGGGPGRGQPAAARESWPSAWRRPRGSHPRGSPPAGPVAGERLSGSRGRARRRHSQAASQADGRPGGHSSHVHAGRGPGW